jgi:hypothetical protein
MNLESLLEPVEHEATPCKILKIIMELEDPYRSAVVQMLNTRFMDGGLSDEKLSMKMKKAGLRVSWQVIYRHRSKICCCYRGK